MNQLFLIIRDVSHVINYDMAKTIEGKWYHSHFTDQTSPFISFPVVAKATTVLDDHDREKSQC